MVEQIVVSTDDYEIADVSRKAGAEVIMRPGDISSDRASSEDALLHALNQLDEKPELTVFLQCTSPLTQAEDIDNCIRKLIESGADSAFTASESHRFLWKDVDSAIGINHNVAARKRRQDMEKEYAENGAIYVMRTVGFIQARHRFFGKTVISEMPTTRSWEIDSIDDIQVAEALSISNKRKPLLSQIDAVVFDFDGVISDNAVYVSEEGKESVRCSRSDGWGINRMHKAGIQMVVMSTEENRVVLARCEKLNLECFHQLGDSKVDRFANWCKEHGHDKANVAYVGNDENDVDCLQAAGIGVVPSDAHASAKRVSNLILDNRGGNGAVRELCDLILQRVKK